MIFVTGGTGFLGTHLLHQLVLRGERVRALRRSNSRVFVKPEFSEKIEWVAGDILDIPSMEEAMEGCEHVYHCAAKVSFKQKDREEIMKVNAEGTANVVNVALEKNIRKLVYASSVAAIGRSPDATRINENTEWQDSHLNSNYAISKYLAEREVWRGMAEGLSVAIVNPTIIIGDGNWRQGPPRFFLNVWRGMPAYTSGGTGFVGVQDVVHLMIRLMESDVQNERFILNSEDWSYKDFFFLIADLLGKKRPYINAAPWMTEIVWRLETVRSKFIPFPPLISKETARIARATFKYDAEKIRKATGFEFTPVKTCIQDICRSFLEDVKAGRIKI